MLIAVGMYLSFDTSSAIFAGGLLKALVNRILAGFSPGQKAVAEEKGTLIGSDQPGFYAKWGSWLSILGFASLAYLLVRIPIAGKTAR